MGGDEGANPVPIKSTGSSACRTRGSLQGGGAGTLILREGKYSQELIEIFKAKKLTAWNAKLLQTWTY